MVTLTTAENSVQAALIKHQLESGGITCFIMNEHMANLFPTYQGFLGKGIQIMVGQDDYERGLEILNRRQLNEVRPHCPFCGSENIKDGPSGRSLWQYLLAFLSLIIMVPLTTTGMRKHCLDCRKDFTA